MTTFIQQERIVCQALIAFFCLLYLRAESHAQTRVVDAWVSSVRGDAQRVSSLRSGSFLIKRGDPLTYGDEIVTGGTGRVVIALSDGSQIIVLPNSRVVLKDFHTAQSMRELLEIAFGTIRVKIRHIGNKPNPYRLNSPAASIAVRGTEFTVDVQSSGETLVAVSEGLVEVSPLSDPAVKRLVGQGEFVLIMADGRIGMSMPGPGSELDGRSRISSNSSDPVQRLATAYQNSVDTAAQSSLETAPALFVAFSDAHLDSLENPAQASEFKHAQGRLLMMPSFSRIERTVFRNVPQSSLGPKSSDFPYEGHPHRFDYNLTPQFTFFTPVRSSRYTVGGSIAAGRTSLHALTLYQFSEDALAKLLSTEGELAKLRGVTDGGAANLTAVKGSFIVARSFGSDERTSLGIGIEQLGSDGSFLNVKRKFEALTSGGVGIESNTDIARTRITFGVAHEFNGKKKLDVSYRYGVTSVNQRNMLRSLYFKKLFPFDKTDVSTKSSEISVHWRSPISRSIFYGLESSYLYEQIGSRRKYANQSVARERDLARRLQFGGGLGIALRHNTFFSLDMAGGILNTTKPTADGPANLIRYQRERGSFFSTHAAAQTDLWRKAFSSASFIVSTRKSDFDLDPLAVTPVLRSYLSPPYRQSLTWKFSSMGVGWKFKPNLITEYLFSMDYNRRPPSHSLLLRYTFDVNIFGEN